MTISDPIEMIVADALRTAGIRFQHESEGGLPLDFYLPDFATHLEVKQFHSERIAAQMARAPNVIAIQGRCAAEAFARMIQR